MDGVGAAPPAIDVFAALRLTLAGAVALGAAVHVPAASWSFALSPSSQHRMCFTLARQPSFVGRRRANQQHSVSVYDPISAPKWHCVLNRQGRLPYDLKRW